MKSRLLISNILKSIWFIWLIIKIRTKNKKQNFEKRPSMVSVQSQASQQAENSGNLSPQKYK